VTPTGSVVTLSTSDILGRFGCTLAPGGAQGDREFHGLAPLSHAQPELICFLANEKYMDEAVSANAGAILCSEEHAAVLSARRKDVGGEGCMPQLIVSKEPYVLFARIAQVFFQPAHPFAGVSPQAHVDASAHIDAGATVFPFAFVGPGARIGKNTVVYSGVFVGAASRVGENCILYPNVVVREGCVVGDRCILNPGAVVGGDGFGFAPSGMENVKIPQVGGVRIDDDVELGSNTSVDRGAMQDTRIGKQTKIDSLVMVGHNVQIGESCFIAALSGIGGSAVLGKRVTLAGQVGVTGHVKIGDHVVCLAQGGLTKNTPAPGVYNGTPARPNSEHLRIAATVARFALKKKDPREKDSQER